MDYPIFNVKIVRSNKRDRTITLVDHNGVVRRTEPLDPEEFHYYTNYATGRDLRQLMDTSNCKRIRR